MESTGFTPLPLAAGRKERQLVAGRYRLAAFHRADDSTEVWRALDESANQVVSLEFLRGSDPAGKERFLAAGRRMAAVEQPSVMKVAGVHDDSDGTYIVFEHLVHIPVPLEWLKLAVEPTAPVLAAPTPTIATSNGAPVTTPPPPMPTPTLSTPSAPEPAAEDPSEKPTDRGLSLLLFALRTRELSLIDQPLLEEAAFEFLAAVRDSFAETRLDTSIFGDARAALGRATNISALVSALVRAAAALRGALSIRPRLRVSTPHVRIPAPSMPRPERVKAPRPEPVAKVKAVKVKEVKVKEFKVKAVKEPRPARTMTVPGFLRVRWSRVLTRGLSLGILAAVLVALPQELVANVGNMASQLSATIGERIASMTSGAGLAAASFEVPPLSAYGARFEAQAPYPSAHPNGTVEWVVALRNTGSAGWYRGINGAQASLVLADGTTAGVQTTDYVGPGQVGWFVVHFPAPAEPGATRIVLRPRIDGRGSLPDLGIYATVTVTPNP